MKEWQRLKQEILSDPTVQREYKVLEPEHGSKIVGMDFDMNSTINYTDAPEDIAQSLDAGVVVEDFLPSPLELVRKVEKEKITIAVDKCSLELFKKYAKTHDAKYQNMINGVLEAYADKFLRTK